MIPTATRNLNRLGIRAVRRSPTGEIRVLGQCLTQGRQPPPRLSQLLVYGTVASIGNPSMANSAIQKTAENGPEAAIVRALGRRIHRAGRPDGRRQDRQSAVGSRPGSTCRFVDADDEIESAAGMTHPGDLRARTARPISATASARDRPSARRRPAGAGDRRRRLHGPDDARRSFSISGISVWLQADLDVLLQRVTRRNDRPLLQDDDPSSDLLPVRDPVYALADIVVQSRDEPHETIVDEIIASCRTPLGLAAEDAMTAPHAPGRARRADRGHGRARRARLRHRHRPRPARERRRAHHDAAAPGASCAIVTDATVAKHHLAAADARAATRPASTPTAIVVAEGEATKSYRPLSRSCARRCIVAAHRARRSGRRARRRRDRRSRRLRRGDPAARRRLRADPDHAAGPGRLARSAARPASIRRTART